MDIRRGDIIWVEFNAGNGHIQRGRRPCVVVSTNRINGHGKIINVIPGTTNLGFRYTWIFRERYYAVDRTTYSNRYRSGFS